ncbi:protein JTB isoform X2 [Paramormyrops kingsleyae]|uniref:protein JTB isoform X2 n=1 Tax=Paramormyrops kingsleyae TaxID=1676925 RepID=UPI000CD5D311|nr:protein JTB isoform X2 [Paramormyrops kingsleyae]
MRWKAILGFGQGDLPVAYCCGVCCPLALDPMATPCWQVEEFVVSAECFQCNAFQLKLWPVCNPTGYVEKINCAKSKKDEYKSCRSVAVEERLFWKFEGTVLCLMVVFALLVISRQRALDRRASEKVRRQLESV